MQNTSPTYLKGILKPVFQIDETFKTYFVDTGEFGVDMVSIN